MILVAVQGTAHADTGTVVQRDGRVATASDVLRDAEFGVGTRHPGLHRQVQMYQWQRYDSGYARVWSEHLIDSSGFDPDHANPTAFPVEPRYWVVDRMTLEGRPLGEDVLKVLGQWRNFRPGFSRLPVNLAATFQPEGDGLGSAENPLDPDIGDLRVTWQHLMLPELDGRLELRNGQWVPSTPVPAAEPASARGQGGADVLHRLLQFPGLLALGVAVLVLGVWLRRRRRR